MRTSDRALCWPGEPQKGKACHANLEEQLIEGGALNISFGDNAFSLHDNP
jgi:hypothetical protein